MAVRSRARSTRLLVVALVSVSLVTITIDYREGDDGPLASIGDAALTVISPLQEVVSKVTHPIGNFFSTLFRLPSIRHERDVLRERVDALETQLNETTADRARLADLEALYGLDQSLGPRVETTAAEVIANGVSNFEWTIEIDKGSSDGISRDMPVLASAGMSRARKPRSVETEFPHSGALPGSLMCSRTYASTCASASARVVPSASASSRPEDVCIWRTISGMVSSAA